MRTRDLFTTVRTEGGLLPADLLQRIAAGDSDLEGLKPSDYHLAGGERLNEAISRAWNRLLGAWTTFRAAAEKLPQGDLGTSTTRERWLLILFQELGYGRLSAARAVEIEGKAYPISHLWQNTPIHLVGFRVDLDRRTRGVAGAARTSPHSLVQEFLNRSDDHLWGFVSNGLRLRILRDNVSLTRQSYVEFDLEGMMEGEVYADFALLWLLCHESRVEGERPEQCWLERWVRIAQEQGTRALEDLRDGVTKAIKSLGSGFLAHPRNADLRDKLRSGQLDKQDYFRQLLRLVYRMIFLFAAEDRGLLLDPNADPIARERYTRFYSTARLRRLAEKRRGTKHTDLYHGLRVVMELLCSDTGCPELALPALGSFLWSDQSVPDLAKADIANHYLLDAVRALAFTVEDKVFRVVDYKNMGAEELGSVYESLLEMHPELNADAATFDLKVAPGHERKTTGSYYTPASLVNCLLDSALDPVVDEAAKKDNPEKAILALKVCDPACGSGHFLISAAHRIAKRLAAIRTGDEEPAPEALRQALRDVIGHCIYGVDINPMAVELCKVSLWMEAMEPGKPLTFLDHHIKCGNSLLGTTPALLKKGIPDEAFKPIEGDDRAYCRELKKQNKKERKDFEQGQQSLFYPWQRLGDLATAMVNLDDMPDDTPQAVRTKQERYEELVKSSGYLFGRLWADAWCAAFVWRKVPERDGGPPYAITEEVFRAIEKSPHSVPPWLKDEIQRFAQQYRFFHWHLEFPDVFRVPTSDEEPENEQTGWSGGFDTVVGNPPYVSAIDLKKTLSGHEKRVWGLLFSGAQGAYDIYVLFLELVVQLVNRKGYASLLTPNKYLASPYGVALRYHLASNATLKEIIDVSSTHAFDAASVYPIISTVRQRQLSEFPFVRVTRIDASWSRIATFKHPRTLLSALPDHAWGFLLSDGAEVLGKIASLSSPLGSVCQVNASSTAAESDAYSGLIIDYRSNAPEVAGWPVINTGTIDPYKILWGIKELKHGGVRYIKPYLKDDRSIVSNKRRCEYSTPKIAFAKVASRIEAAFDVEGRYAGLNVNFVFCSGDEGYYYLGIFNSKLMNWVYAQYFGALRMAGGYLQFQSPQLRALPVLPYATVAFRPETQRIVNLVCSVLDDPEHAEETLMELDEIVCALYGLTSKEMRMVLGTTVREIPVADFAAMAYPATDADKAICAAALAVVEQSGGISSMEHLDVLLLVTHPDWCKTFLDQADQRALDSAGRSAPSELFVGQNQSIRWKDCRDYLEKLNALTVAHGSKDQPIGAGAALLSVKSGLPTGVEGVVEYALKALERIRELRKDLSSVSQVQRIILNAFEEQHRLYELVA